MAVQNSWIPLILEGDSQVILQMVTKLFHGKPVSKVTENWKMNYSLEVLRIILHRHLEVQIHHVRRKANKFADLVANYGAKQRQELLHQRWDDHMQEDLRRKCQKILEQDLNNLGCG